MMSKTLNPVIAEKDGYDLIDGCENIFGANQIKLELDHDDLSDAYKIQYNLNPQKDNKTQDMDNDGMTNYQEYTYNMPS